MSHFVLKLLEASQITFTKGFEKFALALFICACLKFARGMPQLVVDGYRRQNKTDVQSNSKKRKFDLTL